MYSGSISTKSRMIGDLVIISPYKTDIILRDVADCQGVRDLLDIGVKQECNDR